MELLNEIQLIRSQGYTTFFMPNSPEHEPFLLIYDKMPTIVGILTFISRINTSSECFEQGK